MLPSTQGCQIFLDTIYQKRRKIYQMAIKLTKWPQNLPNGHKTYQMDIKYTKWP
jgi:hypothetical protein